MVIIKVVTIWRFKRDSLKLVRQNEEDERTGGVNRKWNSAD